MARDAAFQLRIFDGVEDAAEDGARLITQADQIHSGEQRLGFQMLLAVFGELASGQRASGGGL